MAEFIDILSPSALKDLREANTEVLKLISNINSTGASMNSLTIPSSSNNYIAQLNNDLQKQAILIKDLEAKIKSLQSAKARNNQQTVQENVNNGILNRNARQQAVIQSTLAGAYARLSTQMSVASTKLQDLIVRGRTSTQTQKQYNEELKKAQLEFQKYQQRVLQADTAVGKFNRNVGNYPMQAVSGIKNLIGAFGVAGGVALVAQMTKAFYETTKEIQSLDNALKLVTETNTNYLTQQEFLIRISEAYGLEINELTKQFTQFYVTAKDKLASSEIQAIFESISRAGASMGLSVESQQRAFLALNQMMSKGTIQAEELRGQLGEALPGAFGIMAKAVGVTEKELGKMMKNGDLLASEVLPKFAKQLEITYGIENVDRIDNMASAQTRLSNSWTNMVRKINDGNGFIGSFFKGVLNLSSLLIENLDVIAKIFVKIMPGGLLIADILKLVDAGDDYNDQKIAAREKSLKKLEALNKKEKDIEVKRANELKRLDLLEKSGADAINIQSSKNKIDLLDKQLEKQKELNKTERENIEKGAIKNSEVLIKNQAKNILLIEENKKAIDELKASYKGKGSAEIEDSQKQLNILKNERERLLKDKKTLNLQIIENNALMPERKIKGANSSEDEEKKKIEYQDRYNDALERELKIKSDLAIKELERQLILQNDKLKDNTLYYNQQIEIINKIAEIETQIALKKLEENVRSTKAEVKELINRGKLKNQTQSDFNKELNSIQKKSEDEMLISTIDFQNKIEDITQKQQSETLKATSKWHDDMQKYYQTYEGEGLKLDLFGEDPTANFNKFREEGIEKTKKAIEDLKATTADWVNSFKEGFISDSGMTTLFKVLQDEIYNFGDSFAETFLGISEIAQETMALISKASNDNFDNEYRNLEQQKEISLLFAGENKEAKDKINKEYEEKQRQIKIREFKAKQDEAKFNVIIDTAQAIVATLVRTPPPKGIPLAALMAGIGAVQLATISSQQIPEYWQGTDNHIGGLMKINDAKSNVFKEIVQTPDGKLSVYENRNVIVDAPKGTKVFNAEESLNMILAKNNISQSKNNTNNGNYTNIIKERETVSMNIDKKGLNFYVKNGHSQKELVNNQIRFKARNV